MKKVLLRYTLYQLPALALLVFIFLVVRQWVEIPGWVSAGVLAAWILKDIVLFPLTWRAYERDGEKKTNTIIGRTGIARDRLAPSGYVTVRGELWRAETTGKCSNVEKGEAVRVNDIKGLTLLVEKTDQSTIP